MTTSRRRSVIYCRVSTDKQEIDGESLAYQEAKCRQYAELHDIDIVAVLKETKSGFIHYSLRSIMAWSAESERHKIVEYANRRWQTRVEAGLPVGTGRASYGWDWKDKEKTECVVNPEQAAVRLSIFHMFVELDMSLRAITHKLTEDRILTPTYARKFQDQPPQDSEVEIAYCLWRFTTVREILQDLENVGVLVVCKAKQTIGPDGKRKVEVHPNRREIPGGIPALINPILYERAQKKLKTNQVDKSHLPLNKEDYLLRGHIFCATCGCSMKPRTQKKGRLTHKGTDKSYPFYRCTNTHNKYNSCPSLTTVRTSPLDEIVWQECCVLFKRIDELQAALKQKMEAAISALKEAGRVLGVHAKTIHRYQKDGIITQFKDAPYLLIHRDELLKLRDRGFKQRNTDETVRGRIEVTYSPPLPSTEKIQQVYGYPCRHEDT